MKKALLLVTILALLLCAGCRKESAAVPAAETPAPSVEPSQEPSSSPSPEITQGEINTSELDGVYKNQQGMFVIRNVQVGSCSFIADVAEGYLSGTMERDDNTLTYLVNNFFLTAVVDGTTLNVSVADPYTDSVFAGSFEKTADDPYSVSVDDSKVSTTSSLPASVQETVIDGQSVSVYMDPQGRFSAIFPSLFYAASPERMPQDGVCLVGEAGTVYLTVAVQPQATDANSLKSKLETEYSGSTVTVREDGSVLCTREIEESGLTETALYYPAASETYGMYYQYPTDQADYYGSKGDCMQFNFS